jgi:hypothetical protein
LNLSAGNVAVNYKKIAVAMSSPWSISPVIALVVRWRGRFENGQNRKLSNYFLLAAHSDQNESLTSSRSSHVTDKHKIGKA